MTRAPKKENVIRLRTDDELKKRLQQYCKAKNTAMSKIIRLAIEAFINPKHPIQ